MTETNKVTHKRFQLKLHDGNMWEIIKLLREHLGDNDPLMLHQWIDPLMPKTERKWFTSGYDVWIRFDCLDESVVSWFVLRYA